MTAVLVVFIVVATVLCVGTVLLVLGVTHVKLYGSEAIERDGLYRGSVAPKWVLTDSEGKKYSSPPRKSLQAVVFTDHSLKQFPGVVTGIRRLLDDSDIEVVVLLRGPNQIAEPIFHMLGLGAIHVLTASSRLYALYNVRVTPWVIFVDSHGRVRASSLVNHEWQIGKLQSLAHIPVEMAGTMTQLVDLEPRK